MKGQARDLSAFDGVRWVEIHGSRVCRSRRLLPVDLLVVFVGDRQADEERSCVSPSKKHSSEGASVKVQTPYKTVRMLSKNVI